MNIGTRPKVRRKSMIEKLSRCNFKEANSAIKILAESESPEVNLEDVRRVWAIVHAAINPNNPEKTKDLCLLECELAKAGRNGKSLKIQNIA